MTEPAELPPRAATCADASPARAKKKRRRLLPAACACATPEACFACGRCLERHCVCGAAAAASAPHQALCRASRACNCRVQAPVSARCERCLGCRHTGDAAALSHCRCLAHQQQLRRADVDDKKPGDDGGAACGCFQDRPRRRNSVAADPRPAIERRRAIARVKRRAGLPSSRGLYEQKIVAPGVGVDEFGEDCAELSDGELRDGSGHYGRTRATAEEELLDMIPAAYIETSRPRYDAHEPQTRLSWSRSQSFQQAIAALPTSHEREATVRPNKSDKSGGILTEQSINRSLENAMYERDREAAMPSENLVDYLIFAASVKASRIPELIGTFDDTAATALGIVTEEYMKQLVVRSVREPLCVVTRRSIQAYASTILRDFDFAVYLDKCGCPALAQLSENETRHVVNELAHLVCDEFMALQHPSGRYTGPPPGQILAFIGEVVMRELELARTPLQTEPHSALDVTNLHKLKALKLSQHTSKVTGQRIYKYEVSADVGTKHRAKVVVDGFESRESAEQSIKRMHRALEKQDKRLSQIENPPPPSPPKVAEDPIVKDPMVKELYEQLVNQVRQSRTATTSKAPAASESTGDSTHMLEHDKPAPSPELGSTAAVGVAEAQQ